MVERENEGSDQEQNEEMDLKMESTFDSENELDEGEAASAPKPKQILVTDEELKSLQKEMIEYKEKYLRSLADAENSRKRLQKERQELIRHASEKLIVEFLRPLDNFENALRFAQDMSDEVRNWAIGFQMILAQFKDILSQNGVTSIDSLGKPFDPHEHEAVEIVESTTHIPGTIVEECLKGYRMGDRTIRAARVKVAKFNDEKSGSPQE